MGIQYGFFVIPALDGEDATHGMNQFMRSVKLVQVHREFVCQGELSYWAFAIEYLSGESVNPKSKPSKVAIDYKEVLSPEDFGVYARLREWRKETAVREGVPPYVVFTNEQLAKMVEKRVSVISDLQAMQGVGEARVKKYGAAVINIMVDKGSAQLNQTVKP
jgi:superfamily II DNA helicase RecQ